MAGKIDKIDYYGNYIPFLAYSIISMCDITPKLIELYNVFNSSPISKYYKPLNYTTYHMTVYNIWNQREKLHPYQIDQSGRAPKRELTEMNGVMKPALLRMANTIRELKDINEIQVTVSKIRKGSSVVSLRVNIRNPMQKAQINRLRSWCAANFYNDDAELKFHISLGYLYREIEEDLNLPIHELEEWIKENIPVIVVRRPSPTIFLSMENFMPYDNFFDK
ncbi:unnamed protein product [Mytilus coruscus]|uniref:Uncharacterized protein n=1 Tax=Mytilus coruscus TaxID=42192 RepID=A0A6J8AMA8_MYTCO|nr:unnamed protein product [Mytilus coruscus]